jgi:hypothetical protein
MHHHLSSGAGTIGELVADVPSGLTPHQETKKKKLGSFLQRQSYILVIHTREPKDVTTSAGLLVIEFRCHKVFFTQYITFSISIIVYNQSLSR